MAKTKAQIAEKVLQKLGILESGETVDSDDQDIVTDKYDSIYGVLAADDKVSWGSGDDIPTEAVTSIVSIVANDCLSEFIVSQDKQMIVERDYNRAMANLRKLDYVDYVPEETEPHYF